MKRMRVLITLVCVAIYGVAITQTALIGTPPAGDLPERGLFPGWCCLFFGWGQLAWYANPMLLVSHVAMHLRKDWLALLISAVALALAPATFMVKQFEVDEGGDMAVVTGYGPGFYIWAGSILFTVLCQVGLVVAGRRRKDEG